MFFTLCLTGNRCVFILERAEDYSDNSETNWRTLEGFSEHTCADGFVFALITDCKAHDDTNHIFPDNTESAWQPVGYSLYDGNGISLGEKLGVLLFEDGEFGDMKIDFTNARLVFEDLDGDGKEDGYIETADGHKIEYLRQAADNTFAYFKTVICWDFLKGDWLLNGDGTAERIVISDAGDYRFFSPDGSLLSEGVITYDKNYTEGTTYVLTDKDGNDFASFEIKDDGDITLNDGKVFCKTAAEE